MTESENNIVFWGYKKPRWLLMKRGNCSWIEWISYLHGNPSCKSQQTHAVPVMWFIGTVLLSHVLHARSVKKYICVHKKPTQNNVVYMPDQHVTL